MRSLLTKLSAKANEETSYTLTNLRQRPSARPKVAEGFALNGLPSRPLAEE